MKNVDINRRKVLKILGAVAIIPSVSVIPGCMDEEFLYPLNELNPDAVKYIGSFYQSKFPEDHNMLTLKNILCNSYQSNKKIIKQLQQLVHYDFENNDTVNLYGWIVSRTEARIFAIASEIIENCK